MATDEPQEDLDRLIALSDGVFGFAIDRGGFLVDGVDGRQVRFDTLRFAVRPVVFAVSIPVAFGSGQTAVLFWVALFVVDPLSRRVFPAGSFS